MPFEAIVGNRGFLEAGIGWEPVTRAAALVLFEGLNDMIDQVSEIWKPADLKLQELGMDSGIGQIEVEHVKAADFHPGPRRTMIEQPPERFPCISAFAYMSVPSASQFDQFDSSDITLFVESMATSGPIEAGTELAHEAIVHRRISRMTEAVAATIARSGTLLGTVEPFTRPPRGGIGNNSWLKGQGSGTGPRHLWQGSRLQYTLKRHAASA